MPYYRRYIGGISGSALVKTVPVSLFSLFISLSLPLSRSLFLSLALSFFPRKRNDPLVSSFFFPAQRAYLPAYLPLYLSACTAIPQPRLPAYLSSNSFLPQLIPPPTYLFSNSPLLQLTSPPTHSSSNSFLLQLISPPTHLSSNSLFLQLTSSSTHLKRIYDTGIIEYLPVIKMYLRVG